MGLPLSNGSQIPTDFTRNATDFIQAATDFASRTTDFAPGVTDFTRRITDFASGATDFARGSGLGSARVVRGVPVALPLPCPYLLLPAKSQNHRVKMIMDDYT